MLRSTAIARINRGLGFRAGLDDFIVYAMQEAQRDLQSGKTLPKFLLEEDYPLALGITEHAVDFPPGFIRFSDDFDLRYYLTSSSKPYILKKRAYADAVAAYTTDTLTPAGPKVYTLRKDTIDFIVPADQAYTIYCDYYKRADPLTTDIENVWLANESGGADWLIGEAGLRMARDLRDPTAVDVFTALVKQGRSALFGELLMDEDQGGPRAMGEDN